MAINETKLNDFMGRFVGDLGAVITRGTRFRRASETPFNLVLEARP